MTRIDDEAWEAQNAEYEAILDRSMQELEIGLCINNAAPERIFSCTAFCRFRQATPTAVSIGESSSVTTRLRPLCFAV